MAKKEIGAPAIIVKDGPKRHGRDFYSEHDKGSMLPAFCYPTSVRSFKEEADKLEKLFKSQNVPATREHELKEKLRSMKERIAQIDKQDKETRRAIKDDPDYFNARREELRQAIRDMSPSKSDRKKKRVSPREVLQREKGDKGKIRMQHGGDLLTLQEAKQEFKILSHAMDEEAGIQYVEKE